MNDNNDMNAFKNYKVLLKEFYYKRFEELKQTSKLKLSSEEFTLERTKISNSFFSIVGINYKKESELIIEKEIFDIYANPQLFNLNTTDVIYNFINESHFSVGFFICLHLTKDTENAFKFIENVIAINNEYNKPVQFSNKICFVISSEYDTCNKIISEYNRTYGSSFCVIENYNQEGESFCVIELKTGSALHIFCLGAYFTAFQKFNLI